MPADILSRHKKPISRPWIKICGLTQPGNAADCAHLGADAIGLVFYPKSQRNLDKKKAAAITAALPPHIVSVGVFVNESYDSIMDKVTYCNLDAVQLHGNEQPELITRLKKQGLAVIKCLFSVKDPLISTARNYSNSSFFLVECGKGILPGGNAEEWDYSKALTLDSDIPFLLAGGLNPENVSSAVLAANPFGVDVSSGVESSPGVKDIDKVKTFINNTKKR